MCNILLYASFNICVTYVKNACAFVSYFINLIFDSFNEIKLLIITSLHLLLVFFWIEKLLQLKNKYSLRCNIKTGLNMHSRLISDVVQLPFFENCSTSLQPRMPLYLIAE